MCIAFSTIQKQISVFVCVGWGGGGGDKDPPRTIANGVKMASMSIISLSTL